MCVHTHAQSWSILRDPMNYRLPGSSVHRIFQARILKWVAISSSRGSSQSRDRTCVSCIGRQIPYHWGTWEDQHTHTHTHTHTRMLSRFSCVQLCATLWTIACQSPLYMGFSRQEYWREWISMPSSRGSSLTQELNLCLLHLLHWQVGSSLAPPGKWQGSSSLAPPREKGGTGDVYVFICIYIHIYKHRETYIHIYPHFIFKLHSYRLNKTTILMFWFFNLHISNT